MRRARARLTAPIALVLWVAMLLGGAVSAFGASPPAGELDPETTSFDWAGEAYQTTDPADPASCPASSDPANEICDHVRLTVDTTELFWQRHDGDVEISIGWQSAVDDFDLYVYDEAGALVAFSASRGVRTPGEAVVLEEPIGVFEIRVVPIAVDGVGHWGEAALSFERVEPEPEPSPEPAPQPKPGPKPDPGPAARDEGAGGGDQATLAPSGAYAYADFDTGSSGARTFDSRPTRLVSAERATPDRSVVPPELRVGEPPAQVFLAPAPVEAVGTSRAQPQQPDPALLTLVVAALALTALVVFDRLPREERPGEGGTEPAPPSA